MRKLATIQRVSDIQPIKNADAIEVVTVLGWHVVVKKNEFKVGDLCVYFEVDSLLPIRSEFEFLAARGIKMSVYDNKEYRGYRLQTIRLRGQISQGLCQPLSILDNDITKFSEGDDITELLNVIKYEPPIPVQLAGVVKEPFPSFIPKTDEARIQTVPHILEKYKNKNFYVTEKLDGTSATIFLKDGELNVCSRNLNLKEDDNNTLWKIAKKNKNIQHFLEENPFVALQGELVGEGIQKNTLKIKGQTIYFFNMYNFNLNKYYDQNDFIALCDAYALDFVPVVDTEYQLPTAIDDIVAFATRKSLICNDIWAEGVVIRPHHEIFDEDLGRLSFKVVNPEFLLKYD